MMILISSCYWPYVFKHGGWRLFYKFCERFGLPWPIGKYPAGATLKEQQELLDALVNMVEDGAAAVPEGDAVEVLSVSTQGELAQESLIHLCNREMSKALTSQTLATELRQVGSNAAAQTHSARQQDVQASDRAMIAATMDEILRWITRFNFGADVAQPRFEFFKPKDITETRLLAWDTAARIGRPSRKAFHEELNIPEAEDNDDLLTASRPKSPKAEFCRHCGGSHEFAGSEDEALADAAVAAVDEAIANDWIRPAFEMLRQFEADGKSLQEFQAALPGLYGSLDDEAVLDITDQVLALAAAQGMEAAG